MNLDTPYIVTEWAWFKLQLAIYTLNNQARSRIISIYSPSPGKITCRIWCEDTQEFVDKQTSHAEQLRVYISWVQAQKRSIGEILQELPVLKTEFSLERDLTYEILYNYGMGTYAVCTFDEAGVHWGPTEDYASSRLQRILSVFRRG